MFGADVAAPTSSRRAAQRYSAVQPHVAATRSCSMHSTCSPTLLVALCSDTPLRSGLFAAGASDTAADDVVSQESLSGIAALGVNAVSWVLLQCQCEVQSQWLYRLCFSFSVQDRSAGALFGARRNENTVTADSLL